MSSLSEMGAFLIAWVLIPIRRFTRFFARSVGRRNCLLISLSDSVLYVTVHELLLDLAALPAAGRERGAVLTIEYVDGEVVDAEYDPDATEQRSEAAQDRFDRLSRRPDREWWGSSNRMQAPEVVGNKTGVGYV